MWARCWVFAAVVVDGGAVAEFPSCKLLAQDYRTRRKLNAIKVEIVGAGGQSIDGRYQ
jgi:hypothetical protein